MSGAFYFAQKSDINQGCIPAIFAIVGIYIAILFFFCFDERISFSKIMGLVLIIACIAFIAFDPKEASI